MQNSSSKKWKSIFKWLGWIVSLVSRFLPSNLKVWAVAFSTVAGGAVTLLDQCDKQPVKQSPPASTPLPTPSASPSPTPTSKPEPEPLLKVPEKVKAGELFHVELCNVGNRYEVSLYAEENRLGFMGFGKPCMKLAIKLNQKGKRELNARGPDLQVYANVVVE
jgi:hypothetical protein